MTKWVKVSMRGGYNMSSSHAGEVESLALICGFASYTPDYREGVIVEMWKDYMLQEFITELKRELTFWPFKIEVLPTYKAATE